MKIEFNNNGFSANINEDPKGVTVEQSFEYKQILNKYCVLIFAVVAILFATINLAFGLFINFSTKMMSEGLGTAISHWTVVLLVLSITLFLFSVVCGIASLVCFVKSMRKTIDYIGFMVAIVSFIIAVIGIVLNIIGLIVW